MPNSTAATLIGYGLQAAKVGDDTNIPGLDVSTALLRIVDRENRNFVEAPWQVNQPGWDFMIAERGYTLQTSTTITGALTPSSTTVGVTALDNFSAAVISSSAFTTSGGAAVLFSNNIADPFFFDAASATTGAGNLTSVRQLSFTHASSDVIYTMYQMPTNFGRPRSERWRGDGISVDTIPYFYSGTGVPNGYYYSLFYDSDNDRWYVWMPRDVTGQMLMRYDKAATDISTITTTVDVPKSDEEYIVQKVCAHVLRVLSKDPNKIADAENQAAMILSGAFGKRATNKRVTLTRGPIRSPSTFAQGHYMTASGDIY